MTMYLHCKVEMKSSEMHLTDVPSMLLLYLWSSVQDSFSFSWQSTGCSVSVSKCTGFVLHPHLHYSTKIDERLSVWEPNYLMSIFTWAYKESPAPQELKSEISLVHSDRTSRDLG